MEEVWTVDLHIMASNIEENFFLWLPAAQLMSWASLCLSLSLPSHIRYTFFFFFFGGTSVLPSRLHAFMLARQELYHLSHFASFSFNCWFCLLNSLWMFPFFLIPLLSVSYLDFHSNLSSRLPLSHCASYDLCSTLQNSVLVVSSPAFNYLLGWSPQVLNMGP
jgi:hypothetical protein